MQRGDGRNECHHSRRDSDRDVEHIVDHQSGREQACVAAQVLPRDNIGATIVRVGRDCLAVGKIEDHK